MSFIVFMVAVGSPTFAHPSDFSSGVSTIELQDRNIPYGSPKLGDFPILGKKLMRGAHRGLRGPAESETDDRLLTMDTETASQPGRGSRRAVLAQGLVLAASSASVLLCGGLPQGSMGIFLLVAGAALVVIPPAERISPAIWLAAGLVVCACALSLLPAAWLHETGWRRSLLAEGGFGALGRISVVPEVTAFWLAAWAGTLVIGIYLLSQPVSAAAMVRLAAGASLFCAAYAGMAIFSKASGWHPAFQHESAIFGFFWNRNHVSTLLVTGALAGIGALAGGIERRDVPAAIAGALGLAVCCWAVLLESASRGGVVVLALGAGLWILGLGRARLSLPVVVTSGALLVAAALFLFGTENPASHRLLGGGKAEPIKMVTSDGRWKIYQDSLRMAGDFPLTGSGLGTYPYIYPWYANASLTDATALHPESDWLWLVIEAGPLAMIGVLALLALAFRGIFAHRQDEGWSARWALVAAAAAAMLHGILDVPLHRIELGWWVMVLGCLGLARPAENGARIAGRSWQRWAFAAAGAGLGLLGWQLVSAQWLGGNSLPPFAPRSAAAKILALYESGRRGDAFDLAEVEAARWPMDQDLRYQLGVLGLYFEGTDPVVDAAFRAQRLLNPNWPQVPLTQGTAWFSQDKRRAAALWIEAVARQAKIDGTHASHGDAGLGVYSGILSRLREDPEALRLVMPADGFCPALHFAWIRVAPDPGDRIRQLAGDPAFREGLSSRQKAEFLSLWSSHGDAAALEAFLRENPAWEDDAWGARIKSRVAARDYAGAVEILRKEFLVSLDPPDTSGNELEHPDSSGNSLEKEYAALAAARNDVAARRILDEAARSGGERAAAAHRLRAALAAQKGDWATAYRELIAHLTASGQQLSPIL